MTAPLALAPAPARATTTITLSLGLMTIPLSVYTGVEETRVARSEFLKGDPTHPVGRAPIDKTTGQVVEQADVVRMAQAANNAWVVLTDDEIAACTTDRGLATIETFVPLNEAEQYLTVDVKQVRPKREKGKTNIAYERAWATLRAGMQASRVVALVTVAMRGPARYALLDADGNLFLIASADQVRLPIDQDTTVIPTVNEVNMMRNLIEAVGIDAPVITDSTAPKVWAFVNAKAQGAPAPAPVVVAVPPTDIMAQLQASIDAAKAAKAKVA